MASFPATSRTCGDPSLARSSARRTGAVRVPATVRATIASPDLLTAARAEALFTSDLSAGSSPTRDQVTAAIRRALRNYGGVRGCAAEVAAAYGDCPETAAPRMRWSRGVVDAFYA
jgi:hypothetical protein